MKSLILVFLISALLLPHGAFASTGGAALQGKILAEVEVLFRDIHRQIKPKLWTQPQRARFLVEHTIFSRDNAPLLGEAAQASKAAPAVHAELLRNFHEEIGQGMPWSHFQIYKKGIGELGIVMTDHETSASMSAFVQKFHDIIKSSSLAVIVGAFYASEAVAIPELEFMAAIANQYAATENIDIGKARLLQLYFNIHLNGAEQSHQDELARFIIDQDQYGFALSELETGAAQALDAMRDWWMESNPCRDALSAP